VGLPADSFTGAERRVLAPVRRFLAALYGPPVSLLAALGVHPNAVSLSQIPLGVAVAWLIPFAPLWALALFVATLALDGMDGALARRTRRASAHGALIDQYADHAREVIVIAGLAAHGALHPATAVLYGVAYPGLNVTLYLLNARGVPEPVAFKTYLTFYPALVAYLGFGVNVLDAAGAVAVAAMAVAIAMGLRRLGSA